MAYDPGYVYPDHSDWWRAMRAHFKAKGVVSEQKISALCFRWQRQKGYRFPQTTANTDEEKR